MPDLPSFMHDIEAKVKALSKGNYPTIPERTTADAPYSPRHAHETGHSHAPHTDTPVAGSGKKYNKQVGKRSRKGK